MTPVNAERKNVSAVDRAAWYGFLAYIATLGMIKPSFVMIGQRAALPDLIFPVALLLTLVAALTGTNRIKRSSVIIGVTVWTLAMAVSVVFSADITRSAAKLGSVVYLALVPVMAVQLIDGSDRLRTALLAFVAGMTIPLVVGLCTIALFYLGTSTDLIRHFTYHYGAAPVGNYPRVSSTLLSPSMLLNYLSVGLAFIALLYRQFHFPWHWFIAFIAAIAVCSIFTASIGLGAILLTIAAYAWSSLHRSAIRTTVISAALLGAAGFLLISPFALQPNPNAEPLFANPITGAMVPPSSRWLVWREAVATFMIGPATGVGIGLPSANVLFQNSDGSLSRLTDAHNVVLSIASQTGVVGLIGLFTLIFYVLRAAFAGTVRPELYWLGFAFLSSFIYQGMTGSFEDARHVWLVIGLIACTSGLQQRSTEVAAPS